MLSKNSKKAFALTASFAGALAFGTVSASADTTEYTIKSGDTLNKIAKEFNTTADKIAADNKITDVNMIYVGEKLTFGTATPAPAVAPQVNADAPAQEVAPVAAAPVAEVAAPQVEVAAAPVQQEAPVQKAAPAATVSGNDQSAKETIAGRESSGSYTASNGKYIGRYQLDAAYLNGDHSAANQERVADQYVSGRYGSWSNALSFWNANGWY